MIQIDRSIYREKYGDPSTWFSDCSARPGDYDRGAEKAARLTQNEALIIGMAIRNTPSKLIAAVFCVSRESVDRRLRPLGFKNQPGCVGRPRRSAPLDLAK